MLDEKTMVSDALAGVNGELVRYGEMISQTENKELKQKLKQIRNDCEMSQEHNNFFRGQSPRWRARMHSYHDASEEWEHY